MDDPALIPIRDLNKEESPEDYMKEVFPCSDNNGLHRWHLNSSVRGPYPINLSRIPLTTQNIDSSDNEIDIFLHLLGSCFDMLLRCLNKNGRSKFVAMKSGKWRDVTDAEFCDFLALFIAMGSVVKKNYK